MEEKVKEKNQQERQKEKQNKWLVLKTWQYPVGSKGDGGYFLDTRAVEIIGDTSSFWKIIKGATDEISKKKKRSDDIIFETREECFDYCRQENKKWYKSDFVFDKTKKYVKARIFYKLMSGSNKYHIFKNKEREVYRDGEIINDVMLFNRIIQAWTQEELDNPIVECKDAPDFMSEEDLAKENQKQELSNLWAEWKMKKSACSKMWEKVKYGDFTRNEKDQQVKWAKVYGDEAKEILNKIKQLENSDKFTLINKENK